VANGNVSADFVAAALLAPSSVATAREVVTVVVALLVFGGTMLDAVQLLGAALVWRGVLALHPGTRPRPPASSSHTHTGTPQFHRTVSGYA
jgi:hypothetical protein